MEKDQRRLPGGSLGTAGGLWAPLGTGLSVPKAPTLWGMAPGSTRYRRQGLAVSPRRSGRYLVPSPKKGGHLTSQGCPHTSEA